MDRGLLTAYLEATHARSDDASIAAGARDLGAALARGGLVGIALENVGAARWGSSGVSVAAFARQVLDRWAELRGAASGT